MAQPVDSPLNWTTAATAAVSMGIASLIWWRRLGRLTRLRRNVALIHQVSEPVHRAGNAEEMLGVLAGGLPESLGLQAAAILLRDDESGGLAAAAGRTNEEELNAAGDCLEEGRMVDRGHYLCVPMSAQGTVRGVLLLRRNGQGAEAAEEERAALRHLADQAAIALELAAQRRMREHLLRSEKLGAAGQLISSVASDLQPRVERIAAEARRHGLEELAGDADGVVQSLSRLIALGSPERTRVAVFDLNKVLEGLAGFRAQAWRVEQITSEVELAKGTLPVSASQGHLEQAFLSLLVQAEQAIRGRGGRLKLASRAMAGRAVVEVSYEPAEPGGGTGLEAGLSVARGLVESHGGQLRHGAPGRFEVELQLADQPSAEPADGPAQCPSRTLTLLLVHPEQAALRALVTAVGVLGHRAVVASSGGEALERSRRFRFDAILAARKLPDMAWAELASAARGSCGWIGQLLAASDAPQPGVPGVQIPVQTDAVATLLWRIDETGAG